MFHWFRASLFFALTVLVLTGCPPKKELPTFGPNYQTPQLAFESWRNAVIGLNLENIVRSYSKDSQAGLRQEINETSPEGLKAMQKETAETQFEIQKVVFETNRAYLRVQRTRDKEVEIEIVNMVREGSDWKLLP